MRRPRIPPLVTDIIQNALVSLDGMEFSGITSCPSCGGAVQGHDRKKKKFAVLRVDSGERVVTITVKRFHCRKCGNLCYADEPFYPHTRIGSLVIDIFHSLSATLPPSRAARVIDTLGIVVDRTTWRNYTGHSFPEIPVVDVFGIRLPVTVVRVSAIAAQSDGSDPTDVIVACGHPSRSTQTDSTSRKIM